MNEIPINDPMIGVPVIEPMGPLSMEKAEFSYTPRQREWWLRVYSNGYGFPQCAFPEYSEERGFYRCEYTHPKGTGIEIHHIFPSLWLKVTQPHANPNDLSTTLGIALHKSHHHYIPHEEFFTQMTGHWRDEEKLTEIIQQQRELAERGIPYWDTFYDNLFMEIAQREIGRHMREHPRDTFPMDVSWGKSWHPKEKRWEDEVI